MNRNPSHLDFHRISSLGECAALPARMHEEVLYEYQTFKFPMTTAEFEEAVPLQNKLFNVSGPSPACPGKTVSPLVADVNDSELEDYFWLTAITLIAFGEGKSFTINGGLIDRVPGVVPSFDGCPSPDGSPELASLYWGGPGWEFLTNYLNAYRFKWMCKRTEIMDISAVSLGITQIGPQFPGAGTSLVPAMPYIQRVNAAMKEKAIPKIFIPQNSAGVDNECVGAPTAQVVYGSPKLNGSMGRPYCMPCPMLLAPGMSLKMSLERPDSNCCYYDAMRKIAVFDGTQSGLPDEDLTHGASVDQAFMVPGGCVTLGIALLGQVMTEGACWEALQNFAVGSPMYEMLKGNPAITALVQRRTHGGSLSGLPDNVKGLLEAAPVG